MAPAPAPAADGTASARDRSDAAAEDAVAVGPASTGASGRLWPWLALAFALLWMATLAWLLWSRRRAGTSAGAASRSPTAPGLRPTLADLRRALDGAGLDEVAVLLQRMADPPAVDLGEVLARLAEPRQRDALLAMRRALWAGEGDPSAARAALRAALREGPQWQSSGRVDTGPVPPLYPPH